MTRISEQRDVQDALINYLIVSIGIVLVSVVQEGSARDRVRNLDEQLAYGKRRLAELDAQRESSANRPNNGGE